jgi:CRP-like cAMP-binding protein
MNQLLPWQEFAAPSPQRDGDGKFVDSILIRKLRNFGPLSDQDKQILSNLIVDTQDVPAREDIVREGDQPTHSCVLLEGFACRYKMTADGQRQILAFQFPGDISDLYSFVLKVMDHSIGALTDCHLGIIPHAKLQDVTANHPHLTRLLWRDTLADSSKFREWMVGIGRRSAQARIAHLLCEMLIRCKAVGLCEGYSYELPVTQSDLADCLGMSLVHINRILQRLRAEGLIALADGTVTIQDWQRLSELAGFDASYMHFANHHLFA